MIHTNTHLYDLIIVSFLLLLSSIALAQDTHQTNYTYAPQWLSPSKVGDFQGDLQVGGSYRSQFSNFIVEPFVTQQLFVEYSSSLGFPKNDWTTLGVSVFKDEAGDLAVRQQGFIVSAAYHLALDDKYRNVISLGVQFSYIRLNLDPNKAIYETDILGSSSDIDRVRLSQLGGASSGLNTGLSVSHRLKNEARIQYGLGLYHLNSPRWEGVIAQNIKPRRINPFAELMVPFGKQSSYTLKLTSSFSGEASVIMPQFLMRHGVKREDKSELSVFYGLGYRLQDALQFMLGFGFSGWDLGLAYDMTVSSAAQYTNYYGAIELGLIKRFQIPKEPAINTFIFCPRY